MILLTCRKCGEVKADSLFNKSKQSSSGLHPYCKACQAWYALERYRRDKLKINRKNIQWYAQNKETRLAHLKETRSGELFSFKNRIYAANRRARARNQADGTATYRGTMRLLEEQEWRCMDCHRDLRTAEKHLDHIMPLAKGGLHSIKNLQWLCQKCNLSKGAKVR